MSIDQGGDVVSPDVPTPFSVEIGTTHAEVAKALGSLDCQNAGDDTDWRSDIAVCTASSGPDFYTFDFELDGIQAEELLADPDRPF